MSDINELSAEFRKTRAIWESQNQRLQEMQKINICQLQAGEIDQYFKEEAALAVQMAATQRRLTELKEQLEAQQNG